MNPYAEFVSGYVRLGEQGRILPLGGFPPPVRPALPANAPRALFFAPHPDDETIAGGLALRLLREMGIKIFNVAVTQGSRKERQAARLKELQQACDYVGFELLTTGPGGLEKINPVTREKDREHWESCVRVIHQILEQHRPRIIFFPHDRDWNSTHIGTHHLVMDALKRMPREFSCFLVETEFWGQMDDPNLMVEISESDLADLVAATSFHVGEVQRNPYHLLLPAWMMDNVRRGGELVGGQGKGPPNFTFAVLQRLRKWRSGRIEKMFEGGRQVSKDESVARLFS